MRYRVQATDRQDGLYAVWQDEVYHAQRSSTDGTMLLVAPGSAAPEDFDTEWNGAPAKIVPEAETGATFSIHTYCRYRDEIYRIAPTASRDTTEAEGLTLRWVGQDETLARQLGLTDFSTSADPAELTALWQERHDFPAPEHSALDRTAPDRTAPDETGGQGEEQPTTEAQAPLLRAIGRTLRALPGPGWQRVGAQFRQLGDYAELEVRVVDGDSAETGPLAVSAPARLSQLFGRLRAAMSEPDTGAWFQGTFTLNDDATFDFDFDADAEPAWRLPPNEGGRPGARAYAAELERFPRERKHVPRWLAAKAGLPVGLEFRLAATVDSHAEGEQPVVNRPPLPPEEIRPLLNYLYRAPVAAVRQGTLPDIFAPQGPPDVPDAFHTDGTWIWPAAVPHYLRKYGLPPEQQFVEQIRAQRYRIPQVPERTRASAEARVLGKPLPVLTPADLPDPDPLLALARGGEPPEELRAGQVLAQLRQSLAELGVADSAYRIGEVAEGRWCLHPMGPRWAVTRKPAEPTLFDSLEAAARFLLGTVLLYPGRARVGAAEDTEPRRPLTDWTILPLHGEPPLHFYRGKRMLLLAEGSTVQRFGNEAGNLLHAASARFSETALPPEREAQRQVYRVQRPLRVLSGITVGWNEQPGGAIAYLLPRPVGHHLETGALARS